MDNGQFVLSLTISGLLQSFFWVDRFVKIYRIRMSQAIRVLLKLHQKQGTLRTLNRTLSPFKSTPASINHDFSLSVFHTSLSSATSL